MKTAYSKAWRCGYERNCCCRAQKIAVWLLTNKKVMKTVLSIVLGVILIIVMPIVAILGIFSGGVEIDTGRLHEMIAEQQTVSAERWAEVENAMKSAGYNAARIQEAKTLFVYVLYEYSEAADFTDKLVGCFEENQTDDELIDAVNAAFGTQINAADFSNIMASTRAAQIDISGYTDPETKNNLDLAQWAVEAEKAGWGYVYGTYGTVLDEGRAPAKSGSTPMRSAAMRHHPAELAGQTDSGLRRAHQRVPAGTMPKPVRRRSAQTICPTSAPIRCITMPMKKGRLIPSPKFPVWLCGTKVISAYISETAKWCRRRTPKQESSAIP